MSLIVEDGTGTNPDAESYVSVTDADAYVAAMGGDGWQDAETEDKERALRRATQYLDARYRFIGKQLIEGQPLEWPRTEWPWPVKRLADATCELAVRALAGDLLVDLTPDDNVERETVGPITTVYRNGDRQTRFAIVDSLLASLVIDGRMSMIRMERA